MKYALLQPNWEFRGSTYFGCPETHIPLELLFARAQLEAAGHDVLVLDAHLERLAIEDALRRVRRFEPDFLVLTTAPTYLFWRCPQPELRLPARWLRELLSGLRAGGSKPAAVAIGPHGSATPGATLRKLDCEIVVQGEPDQVLPRLASEAWRAIGGCAVRAEGGVRLQPGVNQADLRALGTLDWSGYPLALRRHRHHVFTGEGRGAEVEATRGCPWACTFCNKALFRNQFRERPLEAVLADVETLARHGFDYIYFIDEIFGCGRQTLDLLDGLEPMPVQFGIQTRIDLWDEDKLEKLGRAGCISFECGIESITSDGRQRFHKGCRLDTGRMQELLIAARRHIPWVQANLIAQETDQHGDLAEIEVWRRAMIAAGVWVSQPVPVFAFPGTPLYRSLFGSPDDQAWERAHAHYLTLNRARGYFSDVQDQAPAPLAELEAA